MKAILGFALLFLGLSSAHSVVYPNGTFLDYNCSANDNSQSQVVIKSVCYSMRVGYADQYIIVTEQDDTSYIYRIVKTEGSMGIPEISYTNLTVQLAFQRSSTGTVTEVFSDFTSVLTQMVDTMGPGGRVALGGELREGYYIMASEFQPVFHPADI